MDQKVIVGTIGRPHGLRGQVTVRPRTDEAELRFAPGEVLFGDGREFVSTGSSWQQGRLVVGFEKVGDRTAAEALRGIELWADGPSASRSEEEYHDTVLIGLAVVDPAGSRLGEVVSVQHPPAQDLLVVRTASGDRLVPFVTALVPTVDLEAGRVIVQPIPGLLEEVPDED